MKKIIVLLSVTMVLLMQTITFAAPRTANSTRDSIYIANEVIIIPTLAKSARNVNGIWHEDENGWWFEYSGGGYPQDTWEQIENYWYYFNGSGYMITGWRQISEKWYYFETAGTNTQPLGSMIKGWLTRDGNRYFLREVKEGIHPEGSMVTGARSVNVKGYEVFHEFKTTGELQYIYDNVIRRKQDKSNWCWVASAEMVGKYANPSSTLTQSNVVSSMVLQDFNIPGFISMSNIALRKFGGDAIKTSAVYGKPLDFLQTAENISYACPLIAVLKWSATSGHIVVISGFSVDQYIRILDPWEDSRSIFVPYSQALNGYQFETGYGTYTDCIYFGR